MPGIWHVSRKVVDTLEKVLNIGKSPAPGNIGLRGTGREVR